MIPGYPYHVIVRENEVRNLSTRNCQKLVYLSLRSQVLSGFSGFDPIFPTSSSILVSPKLFDSHFWKSMPCPKQFLLSSGNRRYSFLLILTLNPGCVSRRFLFQFQEHINMLCKKDSWIGTFVKACYFIFPKLKRSPNHNAFLWLCEPHPLPMFQLYISPHQCVQLPWFIVSAQA